MSIFTRGQHDRRLIPAQTSPPHQYTADPPVAQRPPWETAPFPACTDPGPQRVPAATRPYVQADPLTAPHIPITEDAVLDYPLSGPAPARVTSPQPVVLTGWQVPRAAYPDPRRDPGPAGYAKVMQIVSAVTGTTSRFEDPRAWDARALTTGEAA